MSAHESIYVYALERVLCLAEAHKADDDTQRLRAALGEITAFIHHAFAEVDQLTLEQRR